MFFYFYSPFYFLLSSFKYSFPFLSPSLNMHNAINFPIYMHGFARYNFNKKEQ